MPFGDVTILGGGLLGGSLALRLAGEPAGPRVRLWARRPATVEDARRAGVAGATVDLAEALGGCDLLILATPVGSMADLAARAVEAGLPQDAVVTDVGSVKRAPEQWVTPVLAGRTFVGSHPMAGSQRTGIEAARADLFEGAACIVSGEGAPAADVGAFWEQVGCRVIRMTAEEHDRAVARVSHLPHMLASLGAMVALEDAELGAISGGGLRDTTRVAAGDPAMWTEILLQNRDALAGPIAETIEGLREMLAHLDAGDEEAVREWLSEAKRRRDQLDG